MKMVLKIACKLLNRYGLSVFLTSLTGALFYFYGAVPQSLYFNQEAITNGEFWRLVSGHLVHSDREHMLWNLLALIILSLLMEQHSRLTLMLALLSGIIIIDYYLWFHAMGVSNYAGLSGVLNTLLVVTLYQQWQKTKATDRLKQLPIIIYSASLLKIVIEIHTQQAIFTHTSWQALPQVHLAGFLWGTLVIISQYLVKKTDKLKPISHPSRHHNYE